MEKDLKSYIQKNMMDFLTLASLQHLCACSLYCSEYISSGAYRENLFHNQELLLLELVEHFLYSCDLNKWFRYEIVGRD